MEEQKIPMVLIAGPTATGKSELAVSLCRETGGEVISADSVQVYRGMDIGSAKIRKEEMGGVPHHLIDVLSPEEPFNVTVFQAMASEAVRGIRGRGHIPVVCGGTGFYIQAMLRNVDFTEAAEDPAVRARLEAEAAEKGAAYMHALLEKTDPEAARKIPAGNLRRVIRALEYHTLTGEKISAHNEREMAKPSGYNSLLFVPKDSVHQFHRPTKADGLLLIFTDLFFCRSSQDHSLLRNCTLYADITQNAPIPIPQKPKSAAVNG